MRTFLRHKKEALTSKDSDDLFQIYWIRHAENPEARYLRVALSLP